MTGFRRNFAPRDSLFFKARLQKRHTDLLVREFETLRLATRKTMRRYPFRIDAITVLPSEILAIWTLPEGDTDFTSRWSMIQSLFAGNLAAPDRVTTPPIHARENRLWERQIKKQHLRTNIDFQSYRQHIHLAAIAEGYVSYAEEWPYSSVNPDVIDTFSKIEAHPQDTRPAPLPPTMYHRRLRASG